MVESLITGPALAGPAQGAEIGNSGGFSGPPVMEWPGGTPKTATLGASRHLEAASLVLVPVRAELVAAEEAL